MQSTIADVEVSAALAGVRRRARLLADAEGQWTWSELLGTGVGLCLAGYLLVMELELSSGGAGLAVLVGVVSGTAYRRLQKRVDALTVLLRDIGYPDRA